VVDVARERRLLRKQGLHLRHREAWGAVFDYSTDRPVDPRAAAFFLHIALVDDPSDLRGDEDTVARNVERIGIGRFPATGISYNALAFNSGRLYEGQPLTRRGAHTVNTFGRPACAVHGGSLRAPSWNNNVNGRALVLPQQVNDPVTPEQIDAAARWAAAQIRAGLAEASAVWHGHRCVTAKACPGQTAYDEIPELQRLTNHYVRHGLEGDMALSDEDKAWIRQAIAEELDTRKIDVGDGREWTEDQVVRTILRKLDKLSGEG
jgi:hypothetical protein